jgi:dihydroflavonol-4-reductase
MKILVTGANGFLASYIIRNLLIKGEEVYGMLRENADKRNLEDLPISRLYGNITNFADVDRATRNIDVIVHAAAVTSQVATDKEYYEVNVLASHCLLQAALRNNVGKFIYVSTANTVGYGTEIKPGTEDLDISSEFKTLGYARSKWMTEKLLSRAAQRGGIEIVILNPSFMLGYDATSGSSSQIFSIFLKNNPIPLPRGGRNFIYVDDVAKAVCNSIYHGRNGQRYLLVNENLSYRDFFDRVESISRVSRKKLYVPDSLLYLAGMGGSFANLMGYHFSLTRHNSKVLAIRSYYSASKAISELGLPQTMIDIGINEALKSHLS